MLSQEKICELDQHTPDNFKLFLPKYSFTSSTEIKSMITSIYVEFTGIQNMDLFKRELMFIKMKPRFLKSNISVHMFMQDVITGNYEYNNIGTCRIRVPLILNSGEPGIPIIPNNDFSISFEYGLLNCIGIKTSYIKGLHKKIHVGYTCADYRGHELMVDHDDQTDVESCIDNYDPMKISCQVHNMIEMEKSMINNNIMLDYEVPFKTSKM